MNQFQLEGTLRNVKSYPTTSGGKRVTFLLVTDDKKPQSLPVVGWDDVGNAVEIAGDGAHGKVVGYIQRRKWTNKEGAEVWETALTCSRYVPTRAGSAEPATPDDNYPF